MLYVFATGNLATDNKILIALTDQFDLHKLP